MNDVESLKNKLWVEKYRPSLIEDFIFENNQMKKAFLNMIVDQQIPHLLLSGGSGSGKTTLANILVSHLDIRQTDILLINASDENSVETVRNKIKNFITTYSMSAFKVVRLEEVDYFSPEAQAILRVMMEEYANTTRFILTCNYDYKIIPAVKSRCQQWKFKAPQYDNAMQLGIHILDTENIKYDELTLGEYLNQTYPDLRKFVNTLQQNTSNNILVSNKTTNDSEDFILSIVELLSTDNWKKIREIVSSSVNDDQWNTFYKMLYSNLHLSPKFSQQTKWDEGVVIIAEHLYKDGFVSDREINAMAMVIRLIAC